MTESKVVFEVTQADIDRVKKENEGKTLELRPFNLHNGKTFEGIFFPPTMDQFEAYMSVVKDQRHKDAEIRASKSFIRNTIVYPTWEKYEEIAGELPGLTLSIGNTLQEEFGLATKGEKKRL